MILYAKIYVPRVKIVHPVHHDGAPPVLHRPPKKEKPILRTNPRLEAPLPPFFSCWAFLNSAVTPAVGSIRKCSTRLRTLSCTPCSVAKRQQFSCPLRAWTLLLKFENAVPYGWMCTVGQVIYIPGIYIYRFFFFRLLRVFFSCEY